MKRVVARLALRLGGGVLLIAAALAAAAMLRWDRTFDGAEPTIRVTPDSALVERGRYLAFGPAHCA